MVVEPRILLLDEPLTGLDQMLRWQLLGDLRKMVSAREKTYILVSHDFGTVQSLADRVAAMRNGEVVQVDTPEVIMKRPNSGLVAKLTGWENVLPGRLLRFDRSNGFAQIEIGSDIWEVPLNGNCLDTAKIGDEISYLLRAHEIEVGFGRECGVEGVLLGLQREAREVVLFVELKNGQVVQGRVKREPALMDLGIGERISISWDRGSALVVPP